LVTTAELVHRFAAFLNVIRAYFLANNISEVSTPVLSTMGATDPHVHSLITKAGSTALYLHSSPEFAMKRLLAAGAGDIYQICSVFRAEEEGRLHRAEFQMCEWYRVGLDHHALMQELDQLLATLWQHFAIDKSGIVRHLAQSDFVTYADALASVCSCPLSQLSSAVLREVLESHGVESPLHDNDSLNDWLDLTMSSLVFSHFPLDRFTFLYDYPISQAALARTGVNNNGDPVALRFEVFHGAVELANGFHELGDAKEQRRRFENENLQRQRRGLPHVLQDEQLLASLEAGFPDCAGVAVGLERLFMILLGANNIADVLPLGGDGVR